MNDPSLQNLLRDAEPEVPPATIDAGTLLTLAQRRRTQRTARRTLAGLGAIAAIACSATLWNSQGVVTPTLTKHQTLAATDGSFKRPVPTPAEVDRLHQEIAALDREAQERLLVVRAATATSATASDEALSNESPRASLDNAELVRLEAARSAALAWQYANVVEHELQDALGARREYQRVIERFPRTTWAELASASLVRLDNAPSEFTPL